MKNNEQKIDPAIGEKARELYRFLNIDYKVCEVLILAGYNLCLKQYNEDLRKTLLGK